MKKKKKKEEKVNNKKKPNRVLKAKKPGNPRLLAAGCWLLAAALHTFPKATETNVFPPRGDGGARGEESAKGRGSVISD